MNKYILLLFLLIILPLASAEGLKNDLSKIISESTEDEELPVIIIFKEKPSQAHMDEAKNMGAKIKKEHGLINAVSAKMSSKNINKLSQNPLIKTIEPDYQVKLVLDKSVLNIGSPNIWEKNITGKGIDVAIIDTGIYSQHTYLDVLNAVDFTGEGIQDLHGHGTHVAGTIASKSTIYTGVAYNANLLNVKVLNQLGQGYSSDVISGIQWAIDNGAEVISLSLGAEVGACDGTDALSLAVNKAVKQGVVAVVAAGNSGPVSGTINSPGCAENAITIGAINDNENIASFSSVGPTADGRTKPDLVAPGVLIISTWKDNSFASLSGTSMATPHVSGVVALLLETDNSLTPEQIKQTLQLTAKDLGLDENVQGSGKVEAYLAYLSLQNQSELPEPPEEELPEKNKTNQGKHLGWTKGKKAGVKSDSFWYPFEKILERVDLALTFNQTKKIEKQFGYAGERLAEADELLDEGKSEEVLEAIKESQENLKQIKEMREETKKDNFNKYGDKSIESITEQSTELDEIILEESKQTTEILGEIYKKIPEKTKPQIQEIIKESVENQKVIKEEIKEIKKEIQESKKEINEIKSKEIKEPKKESSESSKKTSDGNPPPSSYSQGSSSSPSSSSSSDSSSSSSGSSEKSKSNSNGNSKSNGKTILDFFKF